MGRLVGRCLVSLNVASMLQSSSDHRLEHAQLHSIRAALLSRFSYG